LLRIQVAEERQCTDPPRLTFVFLFGWVRYLKLPQKVKEKFSDSVIVFSGLTATISRNHE